MVPLLGGWFRIVLGNQETILDLHDALLAVRAIARGINGENTSSTLNHASHAVRFLPAWERSIEGHLDDMARISAQTGHDGGLWLASIIGIKLAIENARRITKQIPSPVISIYRPLAIMLDMLYHSIDQARGINRRDLADLEIQSIDIPPIDMATFPAIDNKSIIENATSGSHLVLQGNILTRHGSILITTHAGKQHAIDIRTLVSLKPVLNCTDEFSAPDGAKIEVLNGSSRPPDTTPRALAPRALAWSVGYPRFNHPKD
jgi:hypothetical protein